jgi:uncharacterized protein with GYD domain
MPHYLLQAAYTSEAWAAQAKVPEDRIEAIRPIVQRLGGKLVAGFLSFGEYDVVALLEMPDNVAAAAFSMAAAGGGAVKAMKTTPLLSPHEALQAMQRAARSGYEPPAGLFDTETGLGIE